MSELRKRLHHGQAHRDVGHEVTVHHIDVQEARAAAFDCLDLIAETGEISGQNRRRNLDTSVIEHNYGAGLVLVGLGIGVGRGAAGRRLTFTLLAGRALMLLFVVARFTFACGTFALPGVVFALVRFALAGRLALLFTARLLLPFALALALSFVFRFRGRFGLFSFTFVLLLA